jgi:hypothetical protein
MPLKVKTGDGSITAEVRAGSKIESGWNIQSGDGGIELTLPKDLQAEVSGKLNGGGAPLTIHTGDGSIHLREG